MKNYFNLNHNPDAKDLKQLAQKTGLTKRVLQVWFQNARAKHRRHVQLKGGTDSGSLTPLLQIGGGGNGGGEGISHPPSTVSNGSMSPTSQGSLSDMKRDQGEMGCLSESSNNNNSFNSATNRPLSPDGHSDDSASKTLAEYFEAAADARPL
uniref:Homeobox domain-containing protein n=1 Tax=Plectus sambesii TaxID=2011161 RepID=A0A914V1F7_9BILA